MDITNKRVGIWGLGVSGRAALSYLKNQSCILSVLDKQKPVSELADFLRKHHISFFHDPDERNQFFAINDLIVPSPGIDMQGIQVQHPEMPPMIAEVDLFYHGWRKPIIGITGTVGKTSITTLLSDLLAAMEVRVATGGNIGTGMLELIEHRDKFDCAVIELSSFQLEGATIFAPDVAIWTNLYPNHLDRHHTMEAYAEAKKRISLHQKRNHVTVAALALAPFVRSCHAGKTDAPRTAWFAPQKAEILPNEILYYFDAAGNICRLVNGIETIIIAAANIPSLSYRENWLPLAGVLDQLGHETQTVISRAAPSLSLPHNRLEPVGTVNKVDFYNDSKATIMEATIAALAALKQRPVHLLLGGLSKGVDRSRYLHELQSCASVICFGAEAKDLRAACQRAGIPATAFPTLNEAFNEAAAHAQPGSCILLSPGGTSYDLYENYGARGDHFVQLVNNLKKRASSAKL